MQRRADWIRARAAGAALVALCILGATSLAAAEPQQRDSANHGPERVDPFTLAVDTDAVLGFARRAFAERYGGAWIDRGADPPILRVHVKRATRSDEARLAAFTEANPQVDLEPALVSEDQLFRSKKRIARVLGRAHLGQFAVGPDVATETITVWARQTRELRRAVLRTVPPGRVEFRPPLRLRPY